MCAPLRASRAARGVTMAWLWVWCAALIAVVSSQTPRTLPGVPTTAQVPVCLLHMHDANPHFREYGELSLANKLRYAARHGYEMAVHEPGGTYGLLKPSEKRTPGAVLRHDGRYYVDNGEAYGNDPRAATFGKVKLAQHACVGRENYWLLWTDADALVVNQSIRVEEALIDDRYDLMLTQDWLMLNAGMLLMKCSDWTLDLLHKVYNAREFDQARALDQSSFQSHLDKLDSPEHVKFVPKYAMNVYTEEYRPGDFLLHMAGKLYEATTDGAVALMRQFDTLSLLPEIESVDAFFSTEYVLNYYSGTCVHGAENDGGECKPDDKRRLRLKEPLGAMSKPNRYRHVAERYYWLGDWKDEYDVPGWNDGRVPPPRFADVPQPPTARKPGAPHDEL